MSKAFFDFSQEEIDPIIKKIERRWKKNLFKLINDPTSKVVLKKQWLTIKSCTFLFKKLKNSLVWEQHTLVMFGKPIPEPRKVFYCGEKGVVHVYSGKSVEVNDWKDYPEIKKVKDLITLATGLEFNACLLNRYEDGKDYIGFHSDKEVSRENYGAVATLSLGSSRDFIYKSKKGGIPPIKTQLDSGDLIVMFGDTQYYYTHSIPKRAHASTRISLTFRFLNRYA